LTVVQTCDLQICAELASLHAPYFHHAWSEEDFAGML
jgi:hypothetical protein